MRNRLHIVAFVLIAGCNLSKATIDVDAGTVPDGGDAGFGRCARLGFPSVPLLTTGSRPLSVVVADVSGDGKPDLVVANFGADTVSVLVGRGDGTFQATVDYPTGSLPDSVAVADVSGDGKPDLLVANQGANTVSVLVGRGDGTFQAKVDYPTGFGRLRCSLLAWHWRGAWSTKYCF